MTRIPTKPKSISRLLEWAADVGETHRICSTNKGKTYDSFKKWLDERYVLDRQTREAAIEAYRAEARIGI